MELKDFASIAALIISIISLGITLFQKSKETNRTIRKNLSDTLENVSKIGIETTKLKFSADNSDNIIELRRSYNTQRRILIAHADYLASKYDKMATEIDCQILASALTNIGNLERAEHYWRKTIDKSETNAIKHMNLRGFAWFQFLQGQFQNGRKKYEEALSLELNDNDYNRRLITDTYIMWAKVERDYNNTLEFKRVVGLAYGYCSRIGNKSMREEMEIQIRRLEPTTDEPIVGA